MLDLPIHISCAQITLHVGLHGTEECRLWQQILNEMFGGESGLKCGDVWRYLAFPYAAASLNPAWAGLLADTFRTSEGHERSRE